MLSNSLVVIIFMQNERLIRYRDVLFLTGLSKSSLYKKMHDNQFPKSIKIGDKSSAWALSDVDKWIKEQIEKSKK